jgi:hypothetical protein
MKKSLIYLALFIIAPLLTFAQGTSFDSGFMTMFTTFAAFTAAIPFVVEFIKKFITLQGLAAQIVSWTIGIILAFAGYYFNIGIFEPFLWWQSLLFGIGASLAANGLFDTKLITTILNAIGINTKK